MSIGSLFQNLRAIAKKSLFPMGEKLEQEEIKRGDEGERRIIYITVIYIIISYLHYHYLFLKSKKKLLYERHFKLILIKIVLFSILLFVKVYLLYCFSF